MKQRTIFLITTIYLFSSLIAGVTGKISGRITDKVSGEPLIGANVLLQGTSTGAATDIEGYYHIINVSPGYYDLKINMIGYAEKTVTNIRVEIDLTSVIDVSMTIEALASEAIIVQANQKLVRTDVASSQKSISSNQISEMPVSSVSEVIGLSAGVSGLSVRGGGLNETQFMVDGLVLNDERTSEPTTGIPLSAVQDISLQTGGFGAEYRNARSGVINVVTREGSKDSYSGTISIRHSSPLRNISAYHHMIQNLFGLNHTLTMKLHGPEPITALGMSTNSDSIHLLMVGIVYHNKP